ncbi:MAG: DUF4190 domain-containing protein [Verrucomicrobia bacterium]|nr:DUF4190 domain-containing protein [Verrucomicrobiota bacterium]
MNVHFQIKACRIEVGFVKESNCEPAIADKYETASWNTDFGSWHSRVRRLWVLHRHPGLVYGPYRHKGNGRWYDGPKWTRHNQRRENLRHYQQCPQRNNANRLRNSLSRVLRRDSQRNSKSLNDAWRLSRPAMKRHRGEISLVCGILGLIFGLPSLLCFAPLAVFSLPLTIIAWVVGSSDLRQMDAGIMEESGRGMCAAGKVCGIIGTIFSGIALLFCIGAFIVFLAALAAGA